MSAFRGKTVIPLVIRRMARFSANQRRPGCAELSAVKDTTVAAAAARTLARFLLVAYVGTTKGPLRFREQMREESQREIGEAIMTIKSFLLTCGIFCVGYVSNTLLDSALEAAESYFHVQTSTYKIDSNGYIICSPEKPR